MSYFRAENLSLHFGGLKAVDAVSFAVEKGEILSIIGPNGAGKSSIFNLISRIYNPTSGRIYFEDQDITQQPAFGIAKLGIARTFQNIELFENATVLSNLLVGRHRHSSTQLWQELLFLPSVRSNEKEHRRRVEHVIEFLDLAAYRDKLISGLPYGVRKVIELARALCSEPKLILLDEPSSGLNVEETDDMSFWIRDMKTELGVTVLMVEHDMTLVNRVSDRVIALNYGKVLAMGSPAEVQVHPDVVAAYLGAEDDGMSAPDIILKLSNIESYYGPIMAIRGISLEVPRGKIVTLLGANGAGKTTVLKTISGILDPQKGTIEFLGKPIQRMEADKIVRLGLSHVPEGREVFPFLSVRENLMMGAYPRSDRDAVLEDLERVYGYFPRLRERLNQPAGQLSGGEQQMLAIGRALMNRPTLLLLDEPSLGLSPILVKEIFTIIRRVNEEQGMSILLVEQNAKVALETAHYGYVLEIGRVVMNDSCERLMHSKDIQEFYLGAKEAGARGERRWKKKKTWR